MSTSAKPVRKAVIPAAGLGTRFLPFTKAVPKEMLPVVDQPVIQYVIEEAVDAGIEDILIVTSRHKKVIEDHFDRLQELEQQLEAKGKGTESKQIRALSELAQLHYVRQGEALGLGHAIGTARNHIGDEPFVVLLGDDIMRPEAGVVRGMIDAYNEHHCSVVALMEVPPDDISAYGCAAAPTVSQHLVRVTDLVEKPAPEVAPSNLAIMGRYLFTPSIFEEIEATNPGVGGEIQITDAMAGLLHKEQMLGFTFTEGRFDTGKKLDYLRAVVEMALARPDLGDGFRTILGEIVEREGISN
ncbi:MAG: UTP--glucose-1-phosphate uridylyltransferase GalU [Acidimicrobiales bacterium]